jgi:hypothetical protein
MPRKGQRIAGSDIQMTEFLFGLAEGATVGRAAEAAGIGVGTLYYRRRRCAVLQRLWTEALARGDKARAAAEAESREGWAPAFAGEEGTIVRGHAGRGLMRKRKRPVEFDRDRKQAFLDHFAATCNFEASAAEAGISLSPVYRALKADPAFLAGFEEALRIGYLCLEAEALREQREAQRAYAINPTDAAAKAQCFERTMQLLREYKRAAGGTIGRRADRSRGRWTFEAVIDSLEEKLKAFGVEIPDLPSESTPTPPSPIEGEGLENGGDA